MMSANIRLSAVIQSKLLIGSATCITHLLFHNFITMSTKHLVNSYGLLDGSDTQRTELKILQSTSSVVSEGKAAAGKIFNTVTQKAADFIDILFICVRKEFRVWREKTKFPESISDDMETLVHLDPETGVKVSEEPLKQSKLWRERKDNKYAKTQYHFIGVTPENGQMVSLRVGGLGYARARKYLNAAQMTGKQLYEFVTRIGVATEESKGYGKKFVPDFAISEAKIPEEWNSEKMSKLCEAFIHQTLHELSSGE